MRSVRAAFAQKLRSTLQWRSPDLDAKPHPHLPQAYARNSVWKNPSGGEDFSPSVGNAFAMPKMWWQVISKHKLRNLQKNKYNIYIYIEYTYIYIYTYVHTRYLRVDIESFKNPQNLSDKFSWKKSPVLNPQMGRAISVARPWKFFFKAPEVHASVDGRNPAFTSWGRDPFIPLFTDTSQVVSRISEASTVPKTVGWPTECF